MISSKTGIPLVLVAVFLTAVVVVSSTNAAEDIVDKSEIYIDGLRNPRSIAQGKVVELCYRSNHYAFSGKRFENIYTVFMLTPRLDLSGSVGKNGINRDRDVKAVKRVLRELRYYHGPIDGNNDEGLVKAVERFQRELLGMQPDGRIDASGRTLTALRIANSDKLFVNRTATLGLPRDRMELRECVNFIAPQRVLDYSIYHCELSYIIDAKIGASIRSQGKNVTILNAAEEHQLKNHLYQYSSRVREVGSLRVVSNESRPTLPFTLYLKVNDKALVLEAKVAPGFSKDPLKFSWYATPHYTGEIQYKYRLAPEEDEWSVWSSQTETRYYFINAGAHVFEVAARYKNASGQWREVPMVSYDFDLKRAFVSKPIMKVVSGPTDNSNLQNIDINALYQDSKALLIGIGEFREKRLEPLIYVNEDIRRMEGVLKRLKFDVNTLTGHVTKKDILDAIDRLTDSAGAKDRIIIYFSTHGFTDKTVKSRGYIAPYDCNLNDVQNSCIELDALEVHLHKMIDKPVKHLLVILDACSAGLGVIAKNINYQEVRIATRNGSHMLTAGMADQTARMDPYLKMSTFTHYLVQGLSGEADLIEDKVISISELLLYVRYQVAKGTDGAQTPMMGRVSGAGEMIFKLN
jgi:hypothetical protein